MKKLISAIVLLFIMCSCKAQQYTFVATSFSYAVLGNSEWLWSDWTDVSIPIIINAESNTIYINSKDPQFYKIVAGPKKYSDERSSVYEFKASDSKQNLVEVDLRRRNDGAMQLYVEMKNLRWAYTLQAL